MRLIQNDSPSDFAFGKGGNSKVPGPRASDLLAEARQCFNIKTAFAQRHQKPPPSRARLYGETDYQAKSWKGLQTRVIYKAEVNAKGDNPRFIVTSMKPPDPRTLYEDLYSPRGQDENYIKHLKNDLSGDRLSDETFLGNFLRMLYACAAYVVHHELRLGALKGTLLEKAQPSTVINKLCKIAVKVVEYKDRIKLHLPSSNPFKVTAHLRTSSKITT